MLHVIFRAFWSKQKCPQQWHVHRRPLVGPAINHCEGPDFCALQCIMFRKLRDADCVACPNCDTCCSYHSDAWAIVGGTETHKDGHTVLAESLRLTIHNEAKQLWGMTTHRRWNNRASWAWQQWIRNVIVGEEVRTPVWVHTYTWSKA